MATLFRSPLFVRIFGRRPKELDWPVNLLTLRAPNPAQPFAQTEWPNPKSGRPSGSRVDDPLNLASLLAPTVTVRAPGFARMVLRSRGARADDPPNLLPLQNPVAAGDPFAQADWPNTARGRQPQKSDAPSLVYPIQFPNLGTPFLQDNWPNATRSRPPQKSDAALELRPLYAPNPDRPFVGPDWIAAQRRARARVDESVNLLPLYNPAAVAVTSRYVGFTRDVGLVGKF